jgi:hypothetical protein
MHGVAVSKQQGSGTNKDMEDFCTIRTDGTGRDARSLECFTASFRCSLVVGKCPDLHWLFSKWAARVGCDQGGTQSYQTFLGQNT